MRPRDNWSGDLLSAKRDCDSRRETSFSMLEIYIETALLTLTDIRGIRSPSFDVLLAGEHRSRLSL